jgi:hypothetical protein
MRQLFSDQITSCLPKNYETLKQDILSQSVWILRLKEASSGLFFATF